MIDAKMLVELIIVALVVKLILMDWYPPIQRSLQAILCIFLGTMFGVFLNPTKEGLVTGIIGSSFAFYGGELIQAFKIVTNDIKELKK